MSNLKFSHLPVKLDILTNLAYLGYEHMTPIQAASLPNIIDNKDVIGQAKTGSGKTAAFAIGLLSKLDVTRTDVQALVLCPTRELGEQVSKEIRKIARLIPNLNVKTLCGGSPFKAQAASLGHTVHCVVGTPGRVLDHLRRNTLNLDYLETLVLDEADRMLEMGFQDDMTDIIGQTPESRQTLLFSATYPEHIERLSKSIQKNAVFVKADTDPASLEIEQRFFEKGVSEFEIISSLVAHYRPQSTLVFCNTKQKCQEVAQELQDKGYHALPLHGDLDQRQRDEALVLFSNKSLSLLVATDVAARGLDIKDLGAVINVDLADPETHIHRIGRTGRAGSRGLALSLFSPSDHRRLNSIEEYQNQKIIVESLERLNCADRTPLVPTMATLRIGCGKKNKLRAGDILGALTARNALLGSEVGKIDLCDTHSFVAVSREKIDKAFRVLSEEKIKGRFLKVAILSF